MIEKTITCITCPVGCVITVQGNGGLIERVEGHQCIRGEEYARNEFTDPVRILTTTVRIKGADSPLLPVRSDKPVSKELLIPCMEVIRQISISAPVSRYHVIVHNILDTGIDIVATGEAR